MVTAVVTEHGTPTFVAFVLGGEPHTVRVSREPWPIAPFEFGRAYIVETSAGYFTLSSGPRGLVAHPELLS